MTARNSASFDRTTWAIALVALISPTTFGQIATLDKGHQLLVNSGLQIWGLNTDSQQYTFNYSNFTGVNMNAVMWSFNQSNPGVLSAGQKWGKWVDHLGNPATALNATELAHYADLVAIQVGDEQQSDLENPNGATKAWFTAARNANLYTDKLLYVNSTYVNDVNAYINFVATANPDALSWDAYPFGTTGVYPYNWLGKAQIFRRVALGSAIGATGTAARPYGLYLQTYQGGDGARDPGDLEMRWQQFTAWTLGYTFVDAFTAGGGNTSLFNSGNGNSPTQPRYDQFKETARQSLNLGPALTKLLSHGYGPSFIAGKDPSGATNALPIDWLQFNRSNAPINQQYLTSVSAANLGTKNNGNPGDVYVGYFNPLHASYGDPAGTAYFMVTNALGAYLQDPSLLATDCIQQITMNFDFGVTGINSLQRLNRNSGLVEIINTSYSDGGNTVFTSQGNGKYQLQLKLEGGTGDLFKYNDGTAFVGVQSGVPVAYWDSDANAANNDVATGAGLGGNGTWDVGAKWYNTTSNSAFVAGSNVVFAGTAGTVTFTTPQTAISLHFKTTGYLVSGSSLTLAAPTIATDSGVVATINAPISGSNGLIKNGPGTLNLQSAHNYTGNTTINEGVLGIANASLGSMPGAPTPNIQLNNAATLRFNANGIALAANRQVVLGVGGGKFDTNGNDAAIAGNISGSTLTKLGAGKLTLSGANAHAATVISGGTVVASSDANLGAAPASFAPGNITLDGGTLQFAANFDIHNNRGITINAGGGSIDTQGFSNPSGYNAFHGGFQGPGDLTKLGSGTFFAAATGGGSNVSWKGKLIIKEGTWKIVATDGLPYNAPVADGLQAAQVTLDGGTWQLGASVNATSGRRGVTIVAGGGTVDTQGFNLTWAGPWAGSVSTAVLNKIGSGTMRLNSGSVAGTYSGVLNVNAGTLQLDGGTAMGDLAAINLANSAGVGLTISSSAETIGSLAGGGGSGGNVSLSAGLVVGGNNRSTTFGGNIIGSGGLTKTGLGEFTLAGTNTYAGGTTVNGGALVVNGSLTGSAVVQNGATLAGTGTIGGTTTVFTGGHLSPGQSAGTISMNGLAMQSGSFLHADIGPTSDQVIVTTNLAINGTLDVQLATGFAPNVGETFTLMTAAAVNGTFATKLLPTFSYRTFDVIYNPQSVVLKVVPMLPGDYNTNGKVDSADYVVWRDGLGTIYTQADYAVWRAHFGETAGPSASLSSVPEPAGWVILVAALCSLLLNFGRVSGCART